MREKKSAIGFSRVMGLWDAVALGGCVIFGLGLVLGVPILQMAGEAAPWFYLLAALIFLPVVFSLSERASGMPGNGDLYSQIRAVGSAPLLFAGGWLIIGGYISLAGLLAWGIATRLETGLMIFFGIDLEPAWLAAVVVVLGGVTELLRSLERGRLRTILFWGIFLFILGVVIMALIKTPPGSWGLEDISPSRYLLGGVALLGAGLWSIDLVLGYQEKFRRGARTTFSSLLTVWLAGGLLGAILLYISVRTPDLSYRNWLSQISPGEERVKIFVLAAAIALCWLGLAQTLSAGRRLIGNFRRDGYLPRGRKEGRGRVVDLVSFLALLTIVFLILIFRVSILTMAGAASACFLWTTIFILFPYARRRESALPKTRFPRLPLHPFFPTIAIVGGLFFSVLLPQFSAPSGLIWLALGGIYFMAYGRRGGTAVRRQEFLMGDETAVPPKEGYRVLVSIADHRSADSLLKIGGALAAARNGEILALRVVALTEQSSLDDAQTIADRIFQKLEESISKTGDVSAEVRPLVRIAPDVASGILSTVQEYRADLILMGWPASGRALESGRPDPVERVFESTSRPLAILRGEFSGPLQKILVTGALSGNTSAAGQMAKALAREMNGEAVQLRIVRRMPAAGKSPSPVTEDGQLEVKIVEAENSSQGILQEADQYDLLLMGASIDPLLGRSYLGGTPVKIAREREHPTMVVKGSEQRQAFWLRRIWVFISRLLPDISLAERVAVFKQMRHDARADVDFLTLIALAAAIAILGLLLNSAAVIIGAMLVAPLMSPMMAVAHGIVTGNFIMIRRGLISTFKGIGVAIAVSTGITLIVSTYQPTAEILARSEPTILDLLVALAAGAAGAYALSRKSVAAALPGVAISAALVPPLCVVGYGLGSSRFLIAGGAILLFLTNLVAIILVSAVVFLLVGFRPTRAVRRRQVTKAVFISIFSIFILIVPLGIQTGTVVRKDKLEATISSLIRKEFADRALLQNLRVKREGGVYVVKITVFTFAEATGERLEELRDHLQDAVGAPVSIDLTVVPARRFKTDPETEKEENHLPDYGEK